MSYTGYSPIGEEAAFPFPPHSRPTLPPLEMMETDGGLGSVSIVGVPERQRSVGIPVAKIFYGLLAALLLILVVWLFILTVTSPDNQFPLGRLILAVAPQTWAALGIAIAFSFSVIGAGW